MNITPLNLYAPSRDYTDVELIEKYCQSYQKEIWSLIFLIGGIVLIKTIILSFFVKETPIYRFIESASDTMIIIGVCVLLGYAIAANGLYQSLSYSIKAFILVAIAIIGIIIYRMGYIDKIIQVFKNI
jgi:hypothetical protein